MAVAIIAGGTAAADTSQASSYAPIVAFTPAANSLLIGVACHSGTATATGAVFAATGGGLTWTKFFEMTKNAGADTLVLFSAATGASPASLTWTVTCTGDAGTGTQCAIFQITGTEGLAQPYIRQIASNAASTANPSTTFAKAMLTGNGGLFVCVNTTASTTQFTAPTGWTTPGELGEVTMTLPNQGLTWGGVNSGRTDTTVTLTCAAVTAWCMVSMELYVAGTGPTEGDPLGMMGMMGLAA